MLLFVIRKMAANRWMVASLLIGVILAVAMVSTIPIYGRGILTRLLIRDLQAYQEFWGRYPGVFEVFDNVRIDPADDEQLRFIDELSDGVVRELNRGIPVAQLTQSRRITYNYVRARRNDQPESDHVNTSVTATSGLFERVCVVAGRLPIATDNPGVFEAVITESTAASGKLVFGNNYALISPLDDAPLGITLEVVGVVSVADPSDVFWSIPIRRYKGSLLVHESDVRLAIESLPYTRDVELSWIHTFDYQAMDSDDASRLASFAREQKRRSSMSVKMPIQHILDDFEVRERLLKITLWVLQVPLLLMLAFYLFMVSQVLIDHERNDIALMKSRGSANYQIFIIYVLLGSFVSLAALAIGPFLGIAACRILGASSGFLEFVQRKRLRLELTSQTYLYAALAAAVALLTILIPALQASRTTIVLYKQRRARTTRRPVWQLLFLDIIAVGMSIYGLYRFRAHAEIVQLTGLEAAELAIDPMLFFVSTLFVIGAGLLFLLFYPLLVRLVFRLGERRWTPTAFSSFIQVGRGGGKNQFLMLFIILSISVGMFNADAARTLNQNVEEQIRYGLGAPVVVQEEWMQVNESGSVISARPGSGSFDPLEPSSGTEGEGRYLEPEFRRYQELEGVRIATKVFTRDRVQGRSPGVDTFGSVTLMAIIPHEFGQVAWFRSGLLPSHWFNYLNLLAESPAAALVSTSLRDEGVELGDPIYLQWPDQPSTLFYVYGFIDYWPTFNPYDRPSRLAVVNLTYLQVMTTLEPYEVWLLPAPGTTSHDLYDEIDASTIQVSKLTDASQELVRARNDPLLQGTNGTLSLVFLVSLGVCLVGFLIYWIFAIQERTLQFGLIRAMGITRSGIVRMLAMEQVLISGVAVVAGLGIGRLTSQLFAPLLQLVKNAVDTVPPYQVISLVQDQLRIGGFVVAMLILGFVVLAILLARIRIHQAVKLGEE